MHALILKYEPGKPAVLENGEVKRVGADRERKVGVRVIASTNRDLAAEVCAGRFRRDLYYRLKDIRIHLPPLRSREDDDVLIAEQIAARASEGAKKLSETAKEKIRAHAWPGNVRELEHAIMGAVRLSGGATIGPEAIDIEPATLDELLQMELAYKPGVKLADHEKRIILMALERNAGNRKKTAEDLEIGYSTLRRKLEEWGVPDKDTED